MDSSDPYEQSSQVAGGPSGRSANRMAIASVVLGALGISGPAIVLGSRARRRAFQSGTRSGLALVGVALGFAGLIGGLVLRAYLEDRKDSIYPILHAPFGHFITMQPQATELIRIGAVDVYSLRYPVMPSSAGTSAPLGHEWALADVSECAGAAGSPFPTDPSDFLVVFNGAPGSVQGRYVDTIQMPALDVVNSLAPNQCARGYVSFVIPARSRPTAVRYEPLLGNFDRYEWGLAR